MSLIPDTTSGSCLATRQIWKATSPPSGWVSVLRVLPGKLRPGEAGVGVGGVWGEDRARLTVCQPSALDRELRTARRKALKEAC